MTQGIYHGGGLDAACAQWGGAPQDWLDLSTGIAPWPYPLPAFTAEDWTRLPDRSAWERTTAAAAAAYAAPSLDCVALAPGAQALIQRLPQIHPARDVRVLGDTYAEHATRWRAQGATVRIVETPEALIGAEAAVLVNPDNPTGRTLSPADVLRLAPQVGLLVVDESFADVAPDCALGANAATPGLVALRSFGKFYGLAGVRLGCAVAAPALTARIADALGPWAVSGPALRLGAVALEDRAFALAQRARLARAAADLDALLARFDPSPQGCALFRLIASDAAPALADHLARDWIWTRRFPGRPRLLRLGVPDAVGLARLTLSLTNF